MINSGIDKSISKTRMINRRMFLLTTAKAVVFFGIFARLVYLQINESTKYRSLSDKNRFREWKLAPKRGVIKDFFNKEIASNEKVYQLHITPENALDIDRLFFRLRARHEMCKAEVQLLTTVANFELTFFFKSFSNNFTSGP